MHGAYNIKNTFMKFDTREF
jgi:hypothetical protein